MNSEKLQVFENRGGYDMNGSEMTNGQILTKGATGAGASFLAWLLAHVQEINSLLQMACLILGFTISAVTLWKLLFKKSKKQHEKHNRP